MIFGLIIVTVLIGMLMPVQAGINAELTRFLKHPFMGALISFATGTIALIIISLFQQAPFAELKRLSSAPPYFLAGGILGALFVGSSIFLIPRLGATTMIAAFVTGQLVMSVIMDHYGLLGLSIQPISLQRIMGIILLFAGLILVVKKTA